MSESMHPYLLIAGGLGIALLPLAIGAASCYLKISVVFGLIRNGLGTQNLPPQSVAMALSLSLSIIAMWPVLEKMQAESQKVELRILHGAPGPDDWRSIARVFQPWKEFLMKHAGKRELVVLHSLVNRGEVRKRSANVLAEGAAEDWRLLVPASILAELKRAMMIGFSLLLPFLLVDLLVANLLAGLGMYMLSPVSISLPLKLLLFSYADGWLLLSEALLKSYL
jgi:type III secretion protein R